MADDETIRLFPVVGWQLGTLPEGNVLLVLNYLPGEPTKPLTTEQMHALSELHRFGITAAQCDELAAALQKYAKESRTRQTSERR